MPKNLAGGGGGGGFTLKLKPVCLELNVKGDMLLYLFVEFMITMYEHILFKPKETSSVHHKCDLR